MGHAPPPSGSLDSAPGHAPGRPTGRAHDGRRLVRLLILRRPVRTAHGEVAGGTHSTLADRPEGRRRVVGSPSITDLRNSASPSTCTAGPECSTRLGSAFSALPHRTSFAQLIRYNGLWAGGRPTYGHLCGHPASGRVARLAPGNASIWFGRASHSPEQVRSPFTGSKVQRCIPAMTPQGLQGFVRSQGNG